MLCDYEECILRQMWVEAVAFRIQLTLHRKSLGVSLPIKLLQEVVHVKASIPAIVLQYSSLTEAGSDRLWTGRYRQTRWRKYCETLLTWSKKTTLYLSVHRCGLGSTVPLLFILQGPTPSSTCTKPVLIDIQANQTSAHNGCLV